MYVDMYLIILGLERNDRGGNRARMQKCTPFEQKHTRDMTSDVNRCRYALAVSRNMQETIGNENVTENGVPPSGNTRAVVGQSVAGRAPGVVRSKWRE